MKILLHGKDNIGWSIDSDRRHAERFLRDLGYELTQNVIKAQVVHSVWWRQLLTRKDYFLRFKKKIIATTASQVNLDDNDFLKLKKYVALWIAPNKKQYVMFEKEGLRVKHLPFYVDERVFKRIDKSKKELAETLNINFDLLKNKFLIGSFQRDTIGADLKTPKWQKDPEKLVEILSLLPNKDRWLFVLAGPRRHFIINECIKREIPYYYYGQKPLPGIDDIRINTIDLERITLLNNLVDCCLVTSKSEGGPKAVLEASFCKTLIFSTDVGLAPDILDKRCILDNTGMFVHYLSRLVDGKNQDFFKTLTENNFNNVNSMCSYEVIKKQWAQVYKLIENIQR